jgi:hypothetical protein
MGLTVPDRRRQICSRLGTSYSPHVPVTEALDYRKAVCIHCQGKIEFPKTGVGRVIACPHCNQATKLDTTAPAKTSHKRLFVAVGGVVCVAIVVLAVMAGRQIAEKGFLLADAYKQPPLTYSSEKDAPLYGIVLTDDIKRARLVAHSAQVLDKLIALADESEQIRKKAAEWDRMRLDAINDEIKDKCQGLSAQSAKECADRVMQDWQNGAGWQKDKAAVAAARREVDDQTRRLITNGSAFSVDINTRIRVLDVSGYYVKFRVLEGAQKGAIGFITPRYVLVK